MASQPILFSGVQPTGGGIMLGNYMGAIRNWVKLQDSYNCLFCVVDLHAVTVRQEPARLRELSYRNAASYIACGIDPERSLVFMQSHVPAHAELAWLLTCNTWMGELSRMTQFKDKSAKGENIGTGLFTYPSLMAADILLYQTKIVPVGQDQKQHLELARDLAIRMNNTYAAKAKEPLLTVPDVYIPPVGARIMSLSDPLKKMSKSDDDPAGTVFLMDTDAEIEKKFKRAVTDSMNRIAVSDEQPGVKNLLTIQSVITGESPEACAAALEGQGYAKLKGRTAELVIETLRPIREKVHQLMDDKTYLDGVLKRSAEAASARAEKTISRVKEAMGFVTR
ncbi:MAG: tryptophan--tRNA ligase [Bdellovibrionaceae bacterium]|nr:tryptophan--tRNA ligase [Pseudobdellovibrionaceae bacterium]